MQNNRNMKRDLHRYFYVALFIYRKDLIYFTLIKLRCETFPHYVEIDCLKSLIQIRLCKRKDKLLHIIAADFAVEHDEHASCVRL